jgi:hypothetical protein
MATNEIVGTYVSEDGEFTLVITESDYNTGVFEGSFHSLNSPLGEITYEHITANYCFTGPHRFPCMIGFHDAVRQEPDWDYCQSDYWTGYRDSAGNLLMSGSRAYVSPESSEVFSFEQVKFTQVS